jgi:hypothetical protein
VRSCAFYPLYPLLIRGSAPLFGGSHLVAGLVLSNAFSAAAWTLFYVGVRGRLGKRAAWLAVVFLAVYPGALFYQFIYTEGLFLLLVMVLWLGLARRRYAWVSVAAFLLPLARPQGVVCLLPLLWHFVAEAPTPGVRARRQRMARAWRHGWKWVRGRFCGRPMAEVGATRLEPPPHEKPAETETPAPYWLAGAWLGGWVCYFGLMCYWTGNPFEGVQAQRHWGVHAIDNVFDPVRLVRMFFEPSTWHEFHGSVLDRCVFVFALYWVPLLWRLDKGLLVWFYVLVVFPAMSGSFTSLTRYVGTAFPMFLAMGVLLGRRQWAWLRWGLLAGFAGLHAVLLWRFVNFRWAG